MLGFPVCLRTLGRMTPQEELQAVLQETDTLRQELMRIQDRLRTLQGEERILRRQIYEERHP